MQVPFEQEPRSSMSGTLEFLCTGWCTRFIPPKFFFVFTTGARTVSGGKKVKGTCFMFLGKLFTLEKDTFLRLKAFFH